MKMHLQPNIQTKKNDFYCYNYFFITLSYKFLYVSCEVISILLVPSGD
jgi:hypothetical protein